MSTTARSYFIVKQENIDLLDGEQAPLAGKLQGVGKMRREGVGKMRREGVGKMRREGVGKMRSKARSRSVEQWARAATRATGARGSSTWN